MRFLPLLLLLVAGCAAPGRELHRSTTVAPPPAPPLQPGVGAPVMGQPSQQSRGLPRSPHQRQLPPSLEPGLWAGDEPQASRKSEPAPPELFGVLLPGIPVAEDKVEAGFAFTCVGFWGHALPGTGLSAKVNALSPQAKRCMVAHMNRSCVRVIEQMDATESQAGLVTLFVRRNLEALRKSANEFVKAECGGVRLTDSQQKLLVQLTEALDDTWLQPE